ncbi:MAG: polar amino acid transport system substrate-binding protein [Desulforhopalus sp.]|jgi:polar amino acid transport system substrate-binding protein
MNRIVITLLSLLVFANPIYAQEQFVLSGPDDPITALSGKVVAEAYKRLGIQAHIKAFPSARSLLMSNMGEVDGEVSRIKGIDKNYSNLIIVPVAINIVEGVVFTKDVTFSVTGWDSLLPYTIGIKRGTKFAEKGTKGMNVQSVTTNRQLFLKLDLRRTDVIVTARVSGLVELKMLKFEGIQVLEPPLVTMKLYHYLHKKHASLLPALTKVLQDMLVEGRIEEIRSQTISEFLK